MGSHLPPKKRYSPQFLAHVCCGQTAGRMDQDAFWYGGMPRPWRYCVICVRWGPSSPSQKRHSPPIFCPCLLQLSAWMHQDTTWYRSRPQPRRHCVTRDPATPAPLIGAIPPIFCSCVLWPNGWMDQDASWYGG